MKELYACILEGDTDKALSLTEALLSKGFSPLELVRLLAEEMGELGRRFETYQAFLPDLVLAGDSFAQILSRLEPLFSETDSGRRHYTAVVGTVRGDFHDIGKNLLIVALRLNGFKVVDLGTDVPPEDFLAAARKHRADVVGLSTLMRSTLVSQADFLRLLRDTGDRKNYLVSIGGVATSEEWSKSIGADFWSSDVFESARRIRAALDAASSPKT